MWVGRSRSGGPVVVFASRKPATRPRWNEYENYRIWLAARGGDATIAMPAVQGMGGPAEVFFLDRRDRLWHGTDRGEWGGGLEVVELKSGEVRQLPRARWGGYGVYGLAESSDGSVLAFGGTTHMGLYEAFVANVEPERVSRLYQYTGMAPFNEVRQKRWAAAAEPHLPITHILEHGDGFWVLSLDNLIEASPRFKRFRRIHDFSVRYTPGRPDAVGSYPAIVAAMRDGERLLLATRNDGFLEYADGRELAHLTPDQTSGEPSVAVPTPTGLLFLHRLGGSLLTRDGHWKDVELQFTGPEEDPLSEPDVPISDPELIAARSALKTWIHRRRTEPRHPDALAHIEWDARSDLVATEHGLCLRVKGADACTPFALPGVDADVLALARDDKGRLWLAGDGVWLVDKIGRAIALHPKLPFMTDTVVRDIVAVDGMIALSLGDRGVAVIETASVGAD
jgi:hypothetical protein